MEIMSEEQKTEISQTEQNAIGKSDTSGKPNGRKWGIVGGIVLLLLAVIIGIGIYNTPANRLSRQLDLGNRYLDEQNYKQAIVEFDKAIATDPMCVDAYLGKAEAYIGMGDIDKAIQTLQEGYELTEDDELQKKISEVKRNIEKSQTTESVATDVSEPLAKQKEADQIVQYDFELNDFGIAGYDICSNHFEEVCSALGIPIREGSWEYGVDNEYGYMDAYYNEEDLFRFYHNHDNDYALQYDEFKHSKSGYCYYLSAFILGSDMSGFEATGIVSLPDFVNMPFELGNTYEEWCKFINYNEIENKAFEQNIYAETTEYNFRTKWGVGYYSETGSDNNTLACFWQVPNERYAISANFGREGRAYYVYIRYQ